MGVGNGQYPEAALAGASVAGDAIHPEDVAAGVDLHVVALGRRPELDLREVEPARGAPADPAIPTTTESATNRGEIHEKYTS